MKKSLAVGSMAVLFFPVLVYASSIGGAETQGQGKISVGYDGEYIFDRDFKEKKGSYVSDISDEYTMDVEWKTAVEIDEMYRNMVKISYGVLDNLDIYVRLGTADLELKQTYTESGSIPDAEWTGVLEKGTSKMDADTAFAYGIGAKGTLPLSETLFFGCDIQYLRHKNDMTGKGTWTEYDYDTVTGDLTGEYQASADYKGDITFQEWQVAPYVAAKLGNFVPYLGVKYSGVVTRIKYAGVSGDDDDEDNTKDRADDHVGVFVGTDFKITENWKLNVEGRFVDETAVSLGLNYKF
ncbi:MAG: hypothetical protein WBE75_05700 [Candidatus Omnitrophota bacterium]